MTENENHISAAVDQVINDTERTLETLESFHDSSLKQGTDVAYIPVAFGICGGQKLYLFPSEKIQKFIELDKAVADSGGSLESKREFGAEFEQYQVSHVNEYQLYKKA